MQRGKAGGLGQVVSLYIPFETLQQATNFCTFPQASKQASERASERASKQASKQASERASKRASKGKKLRELVHRGVMRARQVLALFAEAEKRRRVAHTRYNEARSLEFWSNEVFSNLVLVGLLGEKVVVLRFEPPRGSFMAP